MLNHCAAPAEQNSLCTGAAREGSEGAKGGKLAAGAY